MDVLVTFVLVQEESPRKSIMTTFVDWPGGWSVRTWSRQNSHFWAAAQNFTPQLECGSSRSNCRAPDRTAPARSSPFELSQKRLSSVIKNPQMTIRNQIIAYRDNGNLQLASHKVGLSINILGRKTSPSCDLWLYHLSPSRLLVASLDPFLFCQDYLCATRSPTTRKLVFVANYFNIWSTRLSEEQICTNRQDPQALW